jgi:hypothetical protein
MNTLHSDKRRQRNTDPAVEILDERIAPSPIHGPIAAEAPRSVLRAELRAVTHSSASAHVQIKHERAVVLRDSRAVTETPVQRFSSVQTGRLVSMVNLGSSSTTSSSQQAGGSQTSRTSSTVHSIFPAPPPTPTPVPPTPVPPTPVPPTPTGILPGNVSLSLATVYQQYEQWVSGGEQGAFSPSTTLPIEFQGSNVGIYVHDGNPADFNTLETELQNLGMQITIADATSGTFAGFLPIAQLPAVGQLPQVPIVSPMLYPPSLN